MSIELKIPNVGESVTEVEVGRWMVKEGQTIHMDQDLVELLTDKVNQVLPSPFTGRITKILIQEGNPAQVGDALAILEEGVKGDSVVSSENTEMPTPQANTVSSQTALQKTASPAPKQKTADTKKDPRVMPAAAHLLEENHIVADDVLASGPGGRITKSDVLSFLKDKTPVREEPQPAPEPLASGIEMSAVQIGSPRREEPERMTPLRRTIAKQLVRAQQTAALLTTFNEVDMSAVMELRSQYQESFVKKHNVKLGFMSFFVRAVVDALKEFPAVNAEVKGDEIIYKHFYDVGIAIGGGKGLVVPVLRNAQRLGLADIEKAIAAYAVKAKANALSLDELKGGTFTITNGGVYGSLLSTPIVNPPQSGVLGMHGIVRRPIAVGIPGKDERVEIRPMMYIALTYDHRIVDGREAVSFLRKVKDLVEDPARLVLDC